MNNSDIAEEMQQYLTDCQKELEKNKEAAVQKAQTNLIEMEYLDENLDVLSPYNGTKINDEDFSLGPNEFQYVKKNK